MELKIYNRSGELKLTVSTSSSSTWNQELMKEYSVSVFLYPPVLRDAGRGGLCAAGGSEVQYKEGVQAQAEGYTDLQLFGEVLCPHT